MIARFVQKEGIRAVGCFGKQLTPLGRRRTSQKPNDELICSFKEAFPHVVSGALTSLPEATCNATSLDQAVVEPVMQRYTLSLYASAIDNSHRYLTGPR